MQRKIKTLFPFILSLTWAWQSQAQTPFCTPKTDYDAAITCSDEPFVARNGQDLTTYAQNYGLENGQYKNLSIRFSLTGENVIIHSPCKISLRRKLTHTADNICLDARVENRVRAANIFKSKGRIHIISSAGEVRVGSSTFFEAQNLELTAARSVSLYKGVRSEVSGTVKITSSLQDDRLISTKIRRGSHFKAASFELESAGRIEVAKNVVIEAAGEIRLVSSATGLPGRIAILREARLTGNNVRISAGNVLTLRDRPTITAKLDLFLGAKGCQLRNATLTGTSRSGNCFLSDANRPPRARINASPLSGEAPLTVTLDASASKDPDGSVASYLWKFSDGTTSTEKSLSKIFQTAGVQRVALTVTDDDGASARKQIFLMVERAEGTPTASFVYSPTEGDAPLTVSFDGQSSSDPDGQIVSYKWIFDDEVTLTGQTAERTFDTAGTYTVFLRVTDDEGLTHQTEEQSITVFEPNTPPMMVGDQTFQGMQNKPLNFTLNGATDSEKNPLTYSLMNAPASGKLSGCLKGTSDLTCTFTPAKDFAGQVVFSYKANDGTQDSETVSVVTMNIVAENSPPVADAGDDVSAISGDLVTLDGTKSDDPEGEDLSYNWKIIAQPMLSNVRLADADSATPSLIVDRDGTYRVSLTVGDGKLTSVPDEVSITVTGETNQSPTLVSISTPQTLQVGTELRFKISGSDSDKGDELSFLARNLPENAKFNGTTREFRFQPSPSQVGSHKVTFIITDGKESASREVTIVVQAPAPDQPTTLSSRVLDGTAMDKGLTVPLAGVKISVEGSSQMAVSDAQGMFTLSNIPAGARIVSLDASGVTAQDGSTYGDFKGRLNIVKNVHNRPFRDYMLPRIAAESMAMVEPDEMTMVQNTEIGVSMMIPAQTAMNMDGSMYSGPLSISMVPVDSAPRELPEDLRPNFLITLQPVNIRFANPVPITFPNLDGLAPGAIVALTSLSERGGFEQVGLGQVTQDGSSIQTISGGIVATTWHAPTILGPNDRSTVQVASRNAIPTESESGDASECRGSIICPSTGVLKEEHQLVEFRDSGETISSRLGYKNIFSLENPFLFRSLGGRPADPDSGIFTTVLPPPVVGLSVAFRGSETEPVYFSTAEALEFGVLVRDYILGTSFNVKGLETGIYSGQAILTNAGSRVTEENPRPSITRSRSPFEFSFISPESEFGRGWRFQDVQRLHGENGTLAQNADKIMLVFGNFNHKTFTRNEDGTYSSPVGDYSTLRAHELPMRGFVRETKEGVRYVFDGKGILIGKLDRFKRRTSYHYSNDGKISFIVHPSGRMTNFAYGADGYVDSITDAAGRITRLEHDNRGNLIKITDSDGSARLFDYASNGTLRSQTDKLGRVKSYAYDSDGKVIRTIRADGTQKQVDTQASQLASKIKGTLSDPIAAKRESSAQHMISDGKGNSTAYQTNSFGSFVREDNPLGGTRLFNYDQNNNLTIVADENNNLELQNRYNRFGDLLSSFRSGIGTVRFGYLGDPTLNYHQPISITDAKNQTTFFEYDSLGNVTRTQSPERHVVRMSYTQGYLLESLWDTSAQTKQFFEYDDNGNQTTVKDRFHQVLVSRTFDAAGNVLTQTDAQGNTTTYTYDNANRLLSTTDAKGNMASFAYDAKGNLTRLTDQRGKITAFVYDDMDRLTQRTDSLGNSETFAYDGNGNLTRRTDRNGLTIGYQYDALNRLVAELDEQGTVLAGYEYDAVGNLTVAENANVRNVFAYDFQNRLVKAATPNVLIFYDYDASGNLTRIRDTETQSSMVLYEYDGNDNLVKMGHSSDQDSSFLRFNYDKGERRTGIAYPNEVTASYVYVPGKQSQIQSLGYSTGTQFDYDYNLNDFVTSISHQRSGITVNQTQNFQYDQLNQLTSATLPVGTGSETFAYDASGNRTTNTTVNDNNQLLSDVSFTYTYDNNGNLTKRTHKTSGEITEFDWDYKNRLIQVLKRASAGTDPASTITYKYDALDRRIEKDVDGTVVKYVYDRDNIYLEYDGDDTFLAKYVHSTNVDEPVRMERPESPYKNDDFPRQEFYFHRDRLGNIAEIADYEGNTVQSYVYDAFGSVTIYDKDGNEITPSSANYLKTPYVFTGRELDPETGLYFYRARYYDPSTGRFISEDPVENNGGGLNFYKYTGNNPVNYTDPTGNFPIIPAILLAGGLSAAIHGIAARVRGDSVGNAIRSGFIEGGSIAVGAAIAVTPAGFILAFAVGIVATLDAVKSILGEDFANIGTTLSNLGNLERIDRAIIEETNRVPDPKRILKEKVRPIKPQKAEGLNEGICD